MNEFSTNEKQRQMLLHELSDRATNEYRAMVQTFMIDDYSGSIENGNEIPGKRIISNIMGYARAMEVLETEPAGQIFIVRN